MKKETTTIKGLALIVDNKVKNNLSKVIKLLLLESYFSLYELNLNLILNSVPKIQT